MCSIARQLNVSPVAMMAANSSLKDRKPPYGVNPGDKLKVPTNLPQQRDNASSKPPICQKCVLAASQPSPSLQSTLSASTPKSAIPGSPPSRDAMEMSFRKRWGIKEPVNRSERRFAERTDRGLPRSPGTLATGAIGAINAIGAVREFQEHMNTIDAVGMTIRADEQVQHAYEALPPGERLQGVVCTHYDETGLVRDVTWTQSRDGILMDRNTSCQYIDERKPTEQEVRDQQAGMCLIPR